MLLLSIAGVWLLTLALLCIAGYGVGRWLTPPALKPYELLLTPLWGYSLVIPIAYYGLNSVLALPSALIAALVVAIGLGVWRAIKPGIDGRLPRVPLNELLLVALLGLIAGLLGVVPLLRAGYLLPIGHGWDIEFYLPLAAYLQDYTYRNLNEAPPAPLLNVILARPTSVRAIGFSYLHGMVDLVGRWSAIGTFPLLLALLRGLMIAPVYVLLRVGLRAGALGSALGALLVAGNELLLWISFNNFAMHVSSMPLVPLATLLTLLALGDRSETSADGRSFWLGHGRALAGAIAATIALTLSYHPALLAYGALAGGLGLWAIVTRRDRLAVLLRGLMIILGCLGLGWLAHWRAPVAFFDVYRAQTPSIGGERFARPTELLGVETFHHLGIAIDGSAWLSGVTWLALGALVLGLGVALWRGAVRRGPALAMLGFALLYALGLRFVIAFPYGFYKGVSYLSFVALGVAGVGLGSFFAAMQLTIPPPIRWLQRSAGAALTILVLGMTGWSAFRLLETYRVPVLASGALAAFAAELRDLPQTGTVLLVDHPELRGPGLGLASLGLYGHEWIGRGQTGFAVFNRSEPGRAAQWALMHPSDDPRAWGFEPDAVAARSPGMILYKAPENATAFLSGNAASYTPASGSLRKRLDSLQVQDLTHGDFVVATPDQSLQLYAAIDSDADQLSWQPLESPGQAADRVLMLDVATDAAQTLTIESAGQQQSFDLAPGVSRLTTRPWQIAAPIEIRAAASPVVVRSAQLRMPGQALSSGADLVSDTFVVRTATEASAPAVATTIDITGAGRDVIQLGLEIYEISERTPRRYAGAALAVRSNEAATLQLDLQALTATLNGGAVQIQPGAIEDGEYFGALWVYHGSALARRVPFVRFQRRAGQIDGIQPLDANATFARMNPPDQQIDATIGPARLTGYTLSPQPARAGSDLRLGLQWQVAEPSAEPLLVFAQILGPDDHKWAAWDGAAGGDWWPSPAWLPGDRLWQELPLKLDPATPPGTYRLVVGLYKASTGERLPVSGPQAQNGLIVLSEIDVQR